MRAERRILAKANSRVSPESRRSWDQEIERCSVILLVKISDDFNFGRKKRLEIKSVRKLNIKYKTLK